MHSRPLSSAPELTQGRTPRAGSQPATHCRKLCLKGHRDTALGGLASRGLLGKVQGGGLGLHTPQARAQNPRLLSPTLISRQSHWPREACGSAPPQQRAHLPAQRQPWHRSTRCLPPGGGGGRGLNNTARTPLPQGWNDPPDSCTQNGHPGRRGGGVTQAGNAPPPGDWGRSSGLMPGPGRCPLPAAPLGDGAEAPPGGARKTEPS